MDKRAQPDEEDANAVVAKMFTVLNVPSEDPVANDLFFIDSRRVQVGNVMAIAQGTWDLLEIELFARCFMTWPCLKFENLEDGHIISVNVGEDLPHILVLSVCGFRNFRESIESSKVQGALIPVDDSPHRMEKSVGHPPLSALSVVSTSQKTGPKAMEDLFRHQGLFGAQSGGSSSLKNASRLQDMVVVLKINGGDQQKLVSVVTPTCDVKVDGPRDSFVRRAVRHCIKYYSEFAATYNVAKFAKTICGNIGGAASDMHVTDF